MSLLVLLMAVIGLLPRIRSLSVSNINPALDSDYGPASPHLAVRYTLLTVLLGAAMTRTLVTLVL